MGGADTEAAPPKKMACRFSFAKVALAILLLICTACCVLLVVLLVTDATQRRMSLHSKVSEERRFEITLSI